MKITRLWLVNFRNYENAVIEFADNNLLVGANGAGKTNILEAVDILATSRSKIVKGLNKCIRHGQAGFAINGQFGDLTVAFRQERDADRTVKINDEILASTSELIGKVNSVIFLPGDLEIIQGLPAVRRKYLDIMLSQTEKDYYLDLQVYTRALKQRNELLKKLRYADVSTGSAPDNFTIWETQLAETGARISQKRREILEFFTAETARLYNEMGFEGTLSLRYKTDVTPDKQANLEALAAARADDIRLARTRFGTHTDDFEFCLDDSKAAEFCSQGQQRLITVACKCAEVTLKTQKLNDPPLVLIDDVLLELDMARLNKIISAIAPDSQKIFTVTDTGRFSPDILRDMKIIKIENGQVA